MAFALLGKLLDIEWMLRRDEGRPSAEVVRHDRELLGGAQPASPERALQLWLEARRRELDERTLGVRASELLTALHLGLVVLSGLAGAGVARGLLRGPAAQEPTNVLSFVLATVIWPLALLLASLLLLLLRGRLGRSVLLEDLYLLGLQALGRLWRRAPGEGEDVARQWRALRRGGRRYRDLELASLLGAAQWYPLAFHAGAALALTFAALFSDLTFAWSTTHDSLGSGTVAAVFRAAAAPWCSTLGVGCVSAELVEATRFSRFTGAYAAPHGALVSGAWWPALLGCLLFYGVLPRLSVSLVLAALVRRRSARLAERVLELRGRLYGVTVAVRRTDATPDGAVPAPAPGPAATPARRALPCWVIAWRGAGLDEAELAAVCERLGLAPERRDAAGDGDFERDEALLREGPPRAAVLLVAEGWEAPDKATRRFIEALRRGGQRPVFVGVLSGAESAFDIWRDRLGLLADPGVSVERIESRRPSAEGVRA